MPQCCQHRDKVIVSAFGISASVDVTRSQSPTGTKVRVTIDLVASRHSIVECPSETHLKRKDMDMSLSFSAACDGLS